MIHRIRSAGILLHQDTILLVKMTDQIGEYWTPPGGGLEPEDNSTKQSVRREFFEEAGISVEVGELICVREFLEPSINRHTAEFFYQIKHHQGQPHLNNLVGLNDEHVIQQVEWVPLNQLDSIRTYPVDIKKMTNLNKKQQFSSHLGSYIEGKDENTNYL